MRIQLEVSEAKARQLRSLMDRTGLRTYADLFNNAVTLAQWAVNEIEQGRIVTSVSEVDGRMKQLSMPFFQHVVEERVRNEGEPAELLPVSSRKKA